VKRRDFLYSLGVVAGAVTFPNRERLFAAAAEPETWSTFEISTNVEVVKPSGATRIWVPAALAHPTPFQKTLSNTCKAEGGSARMIEATADSMGIISADFPAGVKPQLTVTSRVMTRNIAVDLSAPAKPQKPDATELKYFLRPTKLMPTDGIVLAKAEEITKGTTSDVEKARAIYEWIVENTTRNPKTRGCGLGDVRFMLETNDLSGKCADLNALFVGLTRAAGIPARDVYGIRVAKSDTGFKSLGPTTPVVTKAQHCRAEVYLTGHGWVPVDPADVRKVMLEEPPGNRALDDELVKQTRARLFGSWEMNWIAYNFAHDVALPGSTRALLGFFMYPQAETADARLDCLDPDTFKYEITSREIGPTAVQKLRSSYAA